jgi:hypothetical protein
MQPQTTTRPTPPSVGPSTPKSTNRISLRFGSRSPTSLRRNPAAPASPHPGVFDDIRAYMLEAGDPITAKEAARRVLVLENPGLRDQSKITPICTLVCSS